MVVSGIPEENGTRHIMHIADTALEIMEVSQKLPKNRVV